MIEGCMLPSLSCRGWHHQHWNGTSEQLLGGDVDQPACRLDAAITTGLRQLIGADMTDTQVMQAQLPADMGGLAMRMPGRTGAAALAKWAALSEALPAARCLCEEMGYDAAWDAAEKELAAASAELATLGLTKGPSGPTLTEEALQKVTGCTCTAELHAHETLKHQAAPPQDRSRLQGRGGKLLDLHRLAGAWDTLPPEQKEAISSQAGPG